MDKDPLVNRNGETNTASLTRNNKDSQDLSHVGVFASHGNTPSLFHQLKSNYKAVCDREIKEQKREGGIMNSAIIQQPYMNDRI